MHRQSQICKSKFTTCTEKKKITKKEPIETNSITNETNKKNGVLDLSLTKSHSNRS